MSERYQTHTQKSISVGRPNVVRLISTEQTKVCQFWPKIEMKNVYKRKNIDM